MVVKESRSAVHILAKEDDSMQGYAKDFRERSPSRRFSQFCIGALLALFWLTSTAFAGDQQPATSDVPYSGDFLKRSTLTGDWGGLRNQLAAKGVTFDVNLTQVGQGVVSGGRDSHWEYGGRGDLILKMDTGKMGLWPGGFLTAEMEGSWGHGVNSFTGAISAKNTSQLFPIVGEDRFAIPALNFAQFLSHYFGLYAGKLDVMSGDDNEFAHGAYGKGDTQFMNVSLNINTLLLMTCPYTPLGAGVVILPTKDPKAAVINLMVLSAVGSANTAGFDELNGNKLTFGGEARMRTDFFGHTGHQLLGLIYSNKEYTSLDQRLTVDIDTQQLQKVKGTWAAYYNFDQYVYEPKKGSGQGVGIFGRFGASDGKPNPMHYFMSLGVGGKGFAASRPNDSFGIGYYYMWIRNPTFTGPLVTRVFLKDENGGEAYYNFALTPWAMLTPDIQVVRGAQRHTVALIPANRKDIETAVVMGFRLQLLF